MKRLLGSKKFLLGAAGTVLTAAAVIVGVVFFSGREESYRKIQIYQIDGKAEVSRAPEQVIEPYENMMLQDKDEVRTLKNGYLYLKMDEDKYVLTEPLSEFTLEATGTEKDSKTRLNVKKGSVVTHITEPLGKDSTYKVDTPNSTMAVRGTSFRIYVWYDKEGLSHTILQVFEGTVEVHLVYPDGTIGEESREFHSGTTAYIWGSRETSDYDSVEKVVDYFSLDIPTLDFIKVGIIGIKAYPIEMKEVDEIIHRKQTCFMVTFKTKEGVFGRQSVLFDHFVKEPTLKPTPKGKWDYDFQKPIRKDTEIMWKEE